MNYSDFVNKFLKFEEDNNLFDIKYFNIDFWQYVRHNVFNNMLVTFYDAKIIEPGFCENSNLKQSKKEFKKFLKDISNTDFLIFNHPRRTLKDNTYINTHTDYLAKALSKKYNIKVIEEPFIVENRLTKIMHYSPYYFQDTFYTDSIENICGAKIRKYKNKKSFLKLQQFVKIFVNKILAEFNGINIEYMNWVITNQILYLKFAKAFYVKLLKKSKVKSILMFYSPSHTKTFLCSICKKYKIPTIDLQHGMQTEFEPIFYVLNNKNRVLSSLPSKIFSFGKNTINTTHFSNYYDNNIIPVGNYNLEEKYNEYKTIEKPNKIKYILFISQTVLGQHLKEFAKRLSTLLKQDSTFHILYKLHPFENEKDFSDLLPYDNITIKTNSNEDISYLQQIAFCQVGVYSTAIYEGIKFELPTIIVNNLYGSSFSYDLLKDIKAVKYVDSAENIYDLLKSKQIIKPTKNDIKLLWSDDPIGNISKYLSEILDEN